MVCLGVLFGWGSGLFGGFGRVGKNSRGGGWGSGLFGWRSGFFGWRSGLFGWRSGLLGWRKGFKKVKSGGLIWEEGVLSG